LSQICPALASSIVIYLILFPVECYGPKANFKPGLVMGLITWIAVAVIILAVMGLGWNVFVSGVYKGAQKVMGNSTIVKKMTEKV
jgi:hypothetical protein